MEEDPVLIVLSDPKLFAVERTAKGKLDDGIVITMSLREGHEHYRFFGKNTRPWVLEVVALKGTSYETQRVASVHHRQEFKSYLLAYHQFSMLLAKYSLTEGPLY